MRGFMYILECCDGSYYTGSTNDLERRLVQHQNGEGANHTKKHLPVKLVYFEEFQRIDEAFYREKQVQGWSRKKKEALINKMPYELKKLSECMNESHSKNYTPHGPVPFDSAQGTEHPVAERSRSHSELVISTTLNHRNDPVVERRSPVVERRSPVVERRSPVVERRSPVVERRSPVVERRSPVVERRSPVVERSRNHNPEKGNNS